ncbi:MAG: hypothetical protein UR80_C0027G0004 [Parcubacteria group bacterium GW2011_GWB1_35_5]|uniref:Prepilin-type N-terminal cleavage/methylation domain-containing protein n=1 Tax=Candidatus Zambryskibacteria bacterium RIFCSPLOWO2_01_FULL_35_19 TaxID=1802757 RepID=A0A1G2TYJ3_9BACT|nr:MAG: hypothetical protein UR50_C0005G0009 [Parcubacteria group bacterium GW2011_GWC1_34_10]KKP80550.1 MAG: hypothetical protein UR80_C0027G0004 [Parcubacteria group bacterium GW2011_GWB1_35_5]OHA86126.1 MAG: hypothetical protein A2726_00430 [Candidatus Zambryskibacteria bacterium RIFCSPHIGHO2_01_FULL_35_32]OHB02371.1 MAG: hypothetical protein A3A90_01060 [Candidatus Zambryskibacteria bacterium RIFCSPLOWO2_01_FULL_35_19]
MESSFYFYQKYLNKKSLPCEVRAKRDTKCGFSLVEMVIMISVATFSILIIWKIYTAFIKVSVSNPSLFQASFLAEEGIEAVKFMRDDSWTSNIAPLSSGASYILAFDNVAWEATTTLTLIDNQFDRRVVFEDVNRDGAGDIAISGSPDLNTKKVTITVSWRKDTGTTTREITTYVSNIFDN